MGASDERSAAARAARPYNGYGNRPVPENDPFLTQTGPGTPGGEYLRRYWHPFLIASEVKDLPVNVRLLGEDLVCFRDGSGRYGLLHRHCIHRGTSLEFGIVAERGIRCCYHGWHFDIDGSILDTPAEPATSRIRANFVQGAYRVTEAHGLLFAYMGPPEETPPFPYYDTVGYPVDNTVAPFRMRLPCNWVQIVENGCDPIHNAYLHAIVSGWRWPRARSTTRCSSARVTSVCRTSGNSRTAATWHIARASRYDRISCAGRSRSMTITRSTWGSPT